jgi:hypothetical protein
MGEEIDRPRHGLHLEPVQFARAVAKLFGGDPHLVEHGQV